MVFLVFSQPSAFRWLPLALLRPLYRAFHVRSVMRFPGVTQSNHHLFPMESFPVCFPCIRRALHAITRAYSVRSIVYCLIRSPVCVPDHFPSIAFVACAFCYTLSGLAGLPSAFSLLLLQVRDHGLSEGFCDKSSVFTVQTFPILFLFGLRHTFCFDRWDPGAFLSMFSYICYGLASCFHLRCTVRSLIRSGAVR